MNLPLLDRATDADRYEVISGGFDRHLFPLAAIRPDDRVLDIGCGYGRTTLVAARHAADGHVVGNDVVEPMLDQARAAAGVANVTFEHGDAQRHPFPDAGFDVAISRFGVMFFADPVTAFANIARALRPGGRLVFVTVGPPEGNDLARVLASAVPTSGTPAVHSLASPDHIEDVLTRAGFRAVAVTAAETTIAITEDPADFILQWGAFRGIVDETDPAAVTTTREALTAAFRPFRNGPGVHLRSTAWLVHATRS